MCDHDDKHTMTSSKTFIFHSSEGRSVSVSSSDQWPLSFIPTPPPVFSSWTQDVHVQSLPGMSKLFKKCFLQNKNKKISGGVRAAATESSLLTSVQLSVHREQFPRSCLPLSISTHTHTHTHSQGRVSK